MNGIKQFWRTLSNGYFWAFSLMIGSVIEDLLYKGYPVNSFQYNLPMLVCGGGILLLFMTGIKRKLIEPKRPKNPRLSKKAMNTYETGVLAQQYGLPNPTVEEIEAEEQERLARIAQEVEKDIKVLENEDKSFTFHADMCTCGDCTFGQIEYIDRWREPIKNPAMRWYFPNEFLSELEKIDQQVQQIGMEIDKMAHGERRKTRDSEIRLWNETHPGHIYTQILGDDQEIDRRCEDCDD